MKGDSIIVEEHHSFGRELCLQEEEEGEEGKALLFERSIASRNKGYQILNSSGYMLIDTRETRLLGEDYLILLL